MIDKQQALDLLDRAVHQDGYGENYVYPDSKKSRGLDCLYVYDDKPACLIGHVLHLAGIRLDVLKTLEFSTPNTDWIDRGVPINREAINVLGVAQDVQDNGRTWGEALDAARSV